MVNLTPVHTSHPRLGDGGVKVTLTHSELRIQLNCMSSSRPFREGHQCAKAETWPIRWESLCFIKKNYKYLFLILPFLSSSPPKQNQDRKHRTYVYVLTVTETLEAWEDSVNIGTVPPPVPVSALLLRLFVCVGTCTAASRFAVFRQTFESLVSGRGR